MIFDEVPSLRHNRSLQTIYYRRSQIFDLSYYLDKVFYFTCMVCSTQKKMLGTTKQYESLELGRIIKIDHGVENRNHL